MWKRLFLLLLLSCFFYPFCLYGQEEYAYRLFDVNDGLVQQQVTRLFKDSRGYLWVGTKGGLSKFNGESFENFTSFDGLTGGEVRLISEDPKGDILIVTTQGISRYNGARFEVLHQLSPKIKRMCCSISS